MLVTMVGEHAGSRDGVIDSLIAGSGTDTLVASPTSTWFGGFWGTVPDLSRHKPLTALGE